MKNSENGYDHDDETNLIPEIFHDVTRKGFIVTLLISLDEQFKIFCGILRQATAQKLSWTDLKGSSMERFLKYSVDVCKLQPVCTDQMRQSMAQLISARNCIVHNSSQVDGCSRAKEIEAFAKQMKGVFINDGVLTFDFDACVSCADFVLDFMESAYHSAITAFQNSQ